MIYLDHASTSFPKPGPVVAAVQRWFTEVGVSAARGAGSGCAVAANEVAAARAGIAALLDLPDQRVAFVSGATEGLNLTLRALLQPGDHVVTTAFEHSSVVRPLRALQAERQLVLHVVPPDARGGLDPSAVAAELRARPCRLVVMTHASNVTGACFDAAAVAAAAHESGALCVLDASQTAGWHDLRVGADVVIASCHKALQAAPGLGFVAVRAGLDLAPQKQGGTGSSRALDTHPVDWPTAFEAGTPNTPALFGLAAALRLSTNRARTREQLLAYALARCDELVAGLRDVAPIRVLPTPPGPRVPVVSLVHEALDPAELGAILDGAGFVVRTGHHCAPWVHRWFGTEAAGTVRISPGHDTGSDDIAALLQMLREL